MKLYGKDGIKRRLDEIAAKGRVPHAIMFSGKSGSGRKTLAKYTAELLMCENHACGHCATCRNIENNAHPDVIYVKQMCGGKYGIADLRSFVDDSAIMPINGNIKVYIIEDCNTILPTAFGTLLKLIEEPAEYLRFIFTCENTMNVPETIMSRVTEFEVPDTSVAECERYLRDNGTDSAKAKALAEMFGGNIGNCGEYEGELGEIIGAARSIAAAIGAKDFVTAAGTLARYQSKRAEFNAVTERLSDWFRDALAAKSGCGSEPYLKKEARKIAQNFSETEILNMLDAVFELQKNEIYNLNLGLTGAYFISRIITNN